MNACSACGSSILWVEMPSGKKMPVDAKNENMVVVSDDKKKGQIRQVHKSHFATCPKADLFRR